MNTATRHNQRISLTGLYLRHWDSLLPLLIEQGYPADLLVSDVSLGAWRNQHVATELAEQLELALPGRAAPARANPARSQAVSYGQLVGQGIDAEAEGDRHFIDGVDSVASLRGVLSPLLPRTILVLLPRQSYHLGRDNIVFIYLLAQWVGQSAHRLLLVNTDGNPAYDTTFRWTINYPVADNHPDPEPRHPASELAFVPGLIDAPMLPIANHADWASRHLIPLANGYFVVRPEARPTLPPANAAVLQQIGQRKPYIMAYCQYYGRATPFLIGYAWQAYMGGNAELGLLLLKKCEDSAESIHQKGEFTAQLQGMRIADMRFAEAAREELPSPLIANRLQSFRHQTIGWGKAMTGDFIAAELHFDQAAELQKPFADPLEEAYFNNIRAFAQYRTGNVHQALRLEKAVEQLHHAQPQEDYRLTYINSINQARLYRSLKVYDKADLYYEKAFATTVGNRSESDLIYTHICRALLSQDRGQDGESFANWFKAALYWVAASYPEAIGWRTLSGITNRRFSPTDDVIEETSRALLLRLHDLHRRCYGTELDYATTTDAGFVMASRQPVAPTAVAGSSILLVSTSDTPVAPVIDGEQYRLLRQFLTAFLRLELGIAPGHAILVPDDGYDTVPSLEALLLLSWQQRVSQLVWKKYSVIITEPAMQQWISTIRTKLSEAIATVISSDQGGEVQYKRYRQPLLLTPQAMQFIRRFSLSPALSELVTDTEPKQSAEVMSLFVKQKLIRYYSPELLEEPEPVIGYPDRL